MIRETIIKLLTAIAISGLLLSGCDNCETRVTENTMDRLEQLLVEIQDWEDVDRAAAAVTELDEEAVEDWLPKLRRTLVEGESFFVREAAANPVARMDGAKSLPILLHALKKGYDEGHDNDGLQAIITDTVDAEPKTALPIVNRLTQSKETDDRQNAAWLLGYLSDHTGSESLIELSKDTAPEVRDAALGALSSFKDDETVYQRLLAGLKDPDSSVAISAASALGYYGDKRAREPLQRFHDVVDPDFQDLVDDAIEQLSE